MSPAVTLARELTAPAPGAVAVVEVAGPEALARVAARVRGRELHPGDLSLRKLVAADGELLDQALVWVESAARVELHLHGSRPLVQRVLAELDLPGAAPPGTLEELALSRLAGANGEAEARVLLDQAEGALRAALEELAAAAPRIRARRAAELARLGTELAPLFDPPRVVLRGPANAGKSTLFNLLVGEERAVVSALAGTTRDAIGAPGVLGAWPAYFIDTAGEREVEGAGQGQVERSGQALARRIAGEADVQLRLVSSDLSSSEPEDRSDTDRARPEVRLRSHADRWAPGHSEAAFDDWPPDAISPVAAPAPTRARVEACLLAELDLPPSPEWESGVAVPFDSELLVAVRRAASGDLSQVEALLAASPVDHGLRDR